MTSAEIKCRKKKHGKEKNIACLPCLSSNSKQIMVAKEVEEGKKAISRYFFFMESEKWKTIQTS